MTSDRFKTKSSSPRKKTKHRHCDDRQVGSNPEKNATFRLNFADFALYFPSSGLPRYARNDNDM